MELRQLKLQQLVFLYDIVTSRSFTNAAKKNFTSQSNVSYAIKELENQLGFPVFERGEKSVILTEKGEQLLPYLLKVLSALEEFVSVVNNEEGNRNREIRIAYSNTLGSVQSVSRLLFELAKQFNSQEDHLQLISTPWTQSVSGNEAEGMEKLLENDRVDMGINWGNTNPKVMTFPIGFVKLCLAVPDSHPLAYRTLIRLEEVASERFTFLGYDNTHYHYYQNMFELLNLKLYQYELDAGWTAIRNYVRAGTCLSIMPLLEGMDDSGIRLIPLDHPMARRPIYLSWNKNRPITDTTEQVRRFILDYYSRIVPY